MKSCRIQALIEELLMDWDKLNLAAKLLVYIGFFLIFATVFISIYKSQNISLYRNIEVIFRTSLSSVFGFFMFGQLPDGYSVAGYFIIIGTAVLMFLYNNGLLPHQKKHA